MATQARAITIENVDILDAGGNGVSGSISEFTATKVILLDSVVSGSVDTGVRSWDAKIVPTLSANDIGVDVVKALRLIDSTISNNTTTGAEGGASSASFAPQFKPSKVLVLRSTVTGNGEGLRIRGPAIIKDSHIDGNLGPGAVLNRPNEDALRCANSTFDANELDGVLWEATLTAKAKLRNCSASDNARHGIHTDFALAYLNLFVGSDLQVTGNGGDGLRLQFIDRRALLKRSTITGNGGHGVHSTSFGPTRPCGVKMVRDTVVVGNGTGADCGVTETCADVAACMNDEPEIDSSSTCETSYVLDSGFPGASWRICALD